jgi:glutamine cyclotransferase
MHIKNEGRPKPPNSYGQPDTRSVQNSSSGIMHDTDNDRFRVKGKKFYDIGVIKVTPSV